MANTTIPSELIQASVALGGSPTTTTQSASDNTTKIATTAYVTAAVNALIDSAPGTMNTLNEIAAALNDDAAFNTTVTNAIATKLPLAGGTMTGNITLGDNNKAIFGAGSDLQIYHDGTDTWIDESGAGSLKIRGNYLQLLSPQDELFFQGQANGSSYIYHNGLEKLATTSTGIDVTGTAVTDGLTATGLIVTEGNAAVNDAQIGRLNFTNTNSNASSNPIRASILSGRQNSAWGGYLSLYTSTGTDAATEKVRIGETGNVGIGLTPKTDWHTGYRAIQIGESSAFFANTAADEVFMVQNARYTSGGWKYNSSGTAALFDMQSGNTRWRRAASGSDDGTISWSDSMFIDTSGHVGIGTTSPTVDLDVSGPSSSMVLPGTSGTTPKGFLRIGYNDRSWGGTEILMGVINDGNTGYASYLQAKAPTDYSVNRTFIINPLGGNLLVGTTSTTVGAGGSGVSGFRVDSDNGIVQAAASGNPSAIFNRTTSNGSLISCRYNGVEVGNIQTEGGDALVIQSGTTSGSGLLFHPSNGQIYPVRNGVKIDNAIDLGRSVNRFKDLYLSGRANVQDVVVTGSVQGAVQIYSSHSYSNNRNWRFISNLYGTGNWGGFSLERSTGTGGTPSEAMFGITLAGLVGIGVGGASGGGDQPAAKLHIKQAANKSEGDSHFRIEGAGYSGFHWLNGTAYYIGQNSNGRQLRMYSGSNEAVGVYLTNGGNSWSSYSDERLKENITDIGSVTEKIKDIRCVTYNRKDVDDENKHETIGFIAQDFVGKFDQVLDESKVLDSDEETRYSIRYTETIPILMKAIQEQQTLIESLTARIETLEG